MKYIKTFITFFNKKIDFIPGLKFLKVKLSSVFAFSMIELLVTVSTLGVISAIAIPSYISYKNDSKKGMIEQVLGEAAEKIKANQLYGKETQVSELNKIKLAIQNQAIFRINGGAQTSIAGDDDSWCIDIKLGSMAYNKAYSCITNSRKVVHTEDPANPATCGSGCTFTLASSACSGGQIFNYGSNTCVCPSGKVFDGTNCINPPTCTPPQFLQGAVCVSPPPITCPGGSGKVPNTANTACVCPPSKQHDVGGVCQKCPASTPYDIGGVCKKCPANKPYDVAGVCKECPAGQILDSTNTCVAPSCPGRKILDGGGTCKCPTTHPYDRHGDCRKCPWYRQNWTGVNCVNDTVCTNGGGNLEGTLDPTCDCTGGKIWKQSPGPGKCVACPAGEERVGNSCVTKCPAGQERVPGQHSCKCKSGKLQIDSGDKCVTESECNNGGAAKQNWSGILRCICTAACESWTDSSNGCRPISGCTP